MAAIGVFIVVYQWAAARPLWLDEEMIALNFRDRTFAGLGGRLWLDQSAPLGWLFLQRLILLIFGSSELVVRALPSAFGMATVIAALYVGRRWLTTEASTVLVVLCSIGQWISFHAVELKPYSADTFFGFLLPCVTVAAATASSTEARRHAIVIWATIAAIAHWFSLGALLVLPACCVVLAMSMRRHPETFRWLAAAGVILVASISVHYLLGIRHAQGSASLQRTWAFALPPPDAGVWERLQWMYGRMAPIASKPGGSVLALAVWISASIGFAAAPNRVLGATAGLVVASGLVLGALGLMPLYERLSLWFVPALYLGIALAADRAVWLFREMPLKRAWTNRAVGAAIATIVLAVCVEVVARGIYDLRLGRPADSNHATDDRSAVAWLMAQRQPGEALVTSKNSLPAIWWYGGVSLAESDGRTFKDGGRIFFAEFHGARRICRGGSRTKCSWAAPDFRSTSAFPTCPTGLTIGFSNA